MNNLKEIKGHAINQWVRLNKVIILYKYTTVILGIAVLGLGYLTFNLASNNIVVAGLVDNEKVLFIGSRRSVSISESDVEAVSRLFLKTRYTWGIEGSEHGERILKELAPFTSEGLLQKIKESLSKNKAVLLQSTQDVIIREVKPESGKVLALIDRVISLNNKMKGVSPLEVTMTLIRGSSNRYNPLGIYINEVIEHESE